MWSWAGPRRPSRPGSPLGASPGASGSRWWPWTVSPGPDSAAGEELPEAHAVMVMVWWSGCQAPGFVEAGLSGAGGFRLGLADGLLADVVGVCWGPGGFVLGGGAHADGAVRADGARASGPTQRWRPRAASMPSQGPGQRISSALYSELSASAGAKPKGVSLGAHRGDCLAVGQSLPVANRPVLHPTVASGAPGQRDQPRCVYAAR